MIRIEMNSGLDSVGELASHELLHARDLMASQGRRLVHRDLASSHRQSLVSSMASVLDGCEYRPELPMLPGVGVGCESPSGAFATLTPLQPLSDKYHHHHHHHQRLAPSSVIGSFAFMRDDRGMPPLNNFYNPYHKDLGMGQDLPPMASQSLAIHSTRQSLASYGHCATHLTSEKVLPQSSYDGHPSMFLRGDQHLAGGLPPPPPPPPPPSLPTSQPHNHGPIQGTQLPCNRAQPRCPPLGLHQGQSPGQMEEINTKEVAQRIMTELKRYSIPQAIFAQRVLCRSQGTLSDLLRNPKPWGKLKSGRETFRRMWKWLQEPEFQRMSALRLEACRRKEHEQARSDRNHLPKKHRLVFTDVQRRTLVAIFKENHRPSKELQVTIARQLGLELSTVGNFFMNSRRRSLDKWLEEGGPCSAGSTTSTSSSASACANS
ncbi:hepatocyte nuclear factor 6-like [Heptranchias perlo]|uniref:hepatocyte nuclear factor 6-like n=1 Tax=Heptranchias perlo TaxID=212740 RepID=UPI00355A7299